MPDFKKILENNGYFGDGTSKLFSFDKEYDKRVIPQEAHENRGIKEDIRQFDVAELKRCADAAKKKIVKELKDIKEETAVRSALFITYPEFGLQGKVDVNLETAMVEYIMGKSFSKSASTGENVVQFNNTEIVRLANALRSNQLAESKYKILRSTMEGDADAAHLIQFLDRVFGLDAEVAPEEIQQPLDTQPSLDEQTQTDPSLGVKDPKMANYKVMARIASLQAEAYTKLAEAEKLAFGSEDNTDGKYTFGDNKAEETPAEQEEDKEQQLRMASQEKTACLAILAKVAKEAPEELKEKVAAIEAQIKAAAVIEDGLKESGPRLQGEFEKTTETKENGGVPPIYPDMSSNVQRNVKLAAERGKLPFQRVA